MTMMTANPRAKIESKSFHLIVIDECQEADDYVVVQVESPDDGLLRRYRWLRLVPLPLLRITFTNLFNSISVGRLAERARQNHFQWDWRDVAKVNENYEKHIRKEMLRIGEDSDEFQMSYNCKRRLERGMFVTSSKMDELGDTSQELVKMWHQTPVVVGIDPARKTDSTVVTVVWVDWDRPDEFGYFDHRILTG
jgi:hypothetical protein